MTLILPVVVSQHAVDQARIRFRRTDWGWRDIKADVTDAVAAGRVAKHGPGVYPKGPRFGARVCWTGCGRRAYLIKRVKSRRDPKVRIWVVITTLVPDHVKEAVA